jgi:hypothetical protein
VTKSLIRLNAEADPAYRPYCLRCPGLVRMVISAPLLWVCEKCLAVHDERTDDEIRARRINDMVNLDLLVGPRVNDGPYWR